MLYKHVPFVRLEIADTTKIREKLFINSFLLIYLFYLDVLKESFCVCWLIRHLFVALRLF